MVVYCICTGFSWKDFDSEGRYTGSWVKLPEASPTFDKSISDGPKMDLPLAEADSVMMRVAYL